MRGTPSRIAALVVAGIAFGGTYTFTSRDHNGLTEADLALHKVEGGTWVPIQ